MSDQTYPVHEVFHTFQGEGVHMGRPAFFIRLFGCPVQCPWCDSAGTWHPKHTPKNIQRMTARELVDMALEAKVNHVVITGGEPCVHDLNELINLLHEHELFVSIETSGAFEIKGIPDWVTLSPKKWKLPIQANLLRAHEFKLIIEEPADIEYYSDIISDAKRWSEAHVWLHPEWSQRENNDVLNAISNALKQPHSPYRAGWQIHKLYRVDFLDVRSKASVPLGGDLSKGF